MDSETKLETKIRETTTKTMFAALALLTINFGIQTCVGPSNVKESKTYISQYEKLNFPERVFYAGQYEKARYNIALGDSNKHPILSTLGYIFIESLGD